MNEYFVENTLSSSYIFDTINPNKGISINITKAFGDCLIIQAKNIEEQLLQIKNSKLSPLISNTITAFEKGLLILAYSNSVSIPSTIPFFVTKLDGKSRSIVFINSFGTKRENDTINISYKALYVLMESAYVALKYSDNPQLFTRNIALMKISCKVYASMAMRIFNREYSLAIVPDIYESINYCFARFFLEKMWELNMSPEIIHTYSLMVCVEKPMDATLLQMDYSNANINDIVDLISFIKGRFNRVKNITMRYYIERYINTYYQTGLLAMDTLPYLLFAIINTVSGGFLLNQPIMIDIMRTIPTLKDFYSELSKLV